VTQPTIDLVDDYAPELKEKAEFTATDEDVEPSWNGRSSKTTLAPGALFLRDGELIGHGSECIDCRKAGRSDRSHQFHIRASVGSDKVWTGPEAGHRKDLLALGMLNRTAEAERRLEREAEIAYIRGVDPSSKCRNCGANIGRDEHDRLLPSCPVCSSRNGLPELKSLTLGQLKKLWGNAASHERALDLEQTQIRSEVAELRKTLQEGLAAPLSELLKQVLGDRAKGMKK
jgi:hypothetical protein